jgi:ribosomal protein S27AE
MDKKTFEAIDPVLDEISEVADDLLESAATEKLRSLLTRLNKKLGSRYLVELHFNVRVFDTENERTLPVLQAGLAGFEQGKPYLASGDSTSQRYIVDGEMLVVPHDRCPRCWEDWDFKLLHPACSHCGISLGKEVKILLDTDVCPHCEEGKVSISQPRCKECGFVVDPSQVTWG